MDWFTAPNYKSYSGLQVYLYRIYTERFVTDCILTTNCNFFITLMTFLLFFCQTIEMVLRQSPDLTVTSIIMIASHPISEITVIRDVEYVTRCIELLWSSFSAVSVKWEAQN